MSKSKTNTVAATSNTTAAKRPSPRISTRPTLRNLNPVFHPRSISEDNKQLPLALIKQARLSGNLNLSGRGLANVPEQVYAINESDKNVPVTLESLVAKEDEAWWNQQPLSTLDMSSNALTTLSPKIQQLFALTTLTLHDNALTTLPKEIGTLEKLTRLNLSRNKLKELPAEFFRLPELRHLNLSHNEFQELHPDISDLHMLEHLDASHNQLVDLPCGIGFLVRLTELLLAHNHIKELPPDLVDMRSLQKLDLMHNDLRSLPEQLGNMRHLQCLYVQHNDITHLPQMEGCDGLQELHVSNNFLQKLPGELCSQLPHLKIFDLRDNQLTQLPTEIALLQNLKRLDISNNSIPNLPYSLAQLGHLVSLQVEGNPIKSIRRDVLQCGTARILKTLRDRSLSEASSSNNNANSIGSLENPSSTEKMVGDGLNSPRNIQHSTGLFGEESIFPDKYKMRKTRSLSTTMQNLTDVPDEVFQIAAEENVAIVDLSKNRLEEVPRGMQLMSKITSELMLANNFLRSVPTFISQFTRLSLVNVSGNHLTDLPKEFGLLNTLRELNVCNNRFIEIPSCVYNLRSLEILLARNNRIQHIDATSQGLGALNRLATLDLRNNNIEQVPPILGNLKNIMNLDIIGNPFRHPRHQILEKGTDAIMSYLRDRIPIS